MDVSTFAVRKDRLGDDEHWRLRRSDTSTFQIADFEFSKPISISPTKQTRPFWRKFWRPVSVGLFMICLAQIWSIIAGDSIVSVWPAPGLRVWLSVSTIGIVVLALTYVIYAGVLYGVKEDNKVNPPVFDEWRYVVPGWQPCHFTFGKEGISVDGTHFLYFFEWADLEEIIEMRNRIILRNRNEHVLTIPSHFFDNGNGGDISWREVRDFIDERKPDRAHWS